MTITVIIPAYNAAAWIGDTLASVFAQTRVPDEVIVVDDASRDDTARLSEVRGARVIRLPANSGGPAVPLNAGLDAARGEIIALLDHDDAWPADKLERAADALNHADLVFGRLQPFGDDPAYNAGMVEWHERVIANFEARRAVIEHRSFVATCSNMVFRRTPVRFDPTVRLMADWQFLADFVPGRRVQFIDAVMAHWRLRPQSLYRAAVAEVVRRETLHVFASIRRWAGGEDTRLLRKHVRDWVETESWQLREHGEFSAAAALLKESRPLTGFWPWGIKACLAARWRS